MPLTGDAQSAGKTDSVVARPAMHHKVYMLC